MRDSIDVRRFTLGETDFVACSKKCKKVTKFDFMFSNQSEQQVLCAFEAMIRKKQSKPVESAIQVQSNSNDYQ
jgi:hypothetical protein